MKCVKCGYISFDHLAVCKKCGVNLNQARSGLGFADSKPEPPSYLRALVDEGSSVGPEAAGRRPGSVGDAAMQIEQAVAEGPTVQFGFTGDPQTAQATAAVVETHDVWAADSKWLGLDDATHKSMAADMPDVDDLILELVDDEPPARAHVGDVSAQTDSDQDRYSLDIDAEESLDDLVLDDFAHGPDGLHLTEPSSDLDLFAKPVTKSVEPSSELEGDLDDLVLELGDDNLDLAELELGETPASR
jgi:hypothetical protein